jgi:hypothetical protein
MPPRKHLTWLWVIAVLLLAGWLALRLMDAYALWWDERWSVYTAGGAHYGPLSPGDIWARATEDVVHPPGYAWLLAAWGALVGWTPFALRYLSLLAGWLAIAWVYRLGYDASRSRLVALSATIAVGASAYFILYLRELRMYALYGLFAVVLLWAYWRLLNRRRFSYSAAGALFIGATGALYSHYQVGMLAGAVGLYHLLFATKNRRWWLTLFILLMAAAAFAPWLPQVLAGVGRFAGQPEVQGFALNAGDILAMLAYGFSNGFAPLLLVLVIAVLAAWRTRAVRFFGFVIVGTLALSLALNQVVPYITHIRYLLALWIPLGLLAGYGVERLARRRYRAVLVGAVLGGWIITGVWNSLTPQFSDTLMRDFHLQIFRPRLPINQMFRIINREHQPGDAVVYSAPVNAFAFSGTFDLAMHPLPVKYTMPDWLPGQNAAAYVEQARRFLAEPLRVWYGLETTMPPDFRQQAFTAQLVQAYQLCRTPLNAPDLRLDLYARSAICCAPPETPRIRFANRAALANVELTQTPAQLAVLMAWQVPADLPLSTYSVALHLDRADQPAVRQADAGLPALAYSCLPLTLSLADLPAGDYTLRVMVYNWQTGAREMGTITATSESGDRLALKTFTLPAR